jgi:hypothetical protein
MLRQEAALDHSIDRKVRILLRLRKESTSRPVAPPDDDGAGMESVERALDRDSMSDIPQSVEAVENSEMNEQSWNLIENKGLYLANRKRSGNAIEEKASYALKAGMLLKRPVFRV